MLVKNQMYGELLGDVEAVDDAAEEAACGLPEGPHAGGRDRAGR